MTYLAKMIGLAIVSKTFAVYLKPVMEQTDGWTARLCNNATLEEDRVIRVTRNKLHTTCDLTKY